VLALRHRLQRALLATLLLSQGTPMLLAGDEIGHSQQGNNNAYCQDNATTRLAWPAADAALLACTRRLLALRRRHPALRQACWLTRPTPARQPPCAGWNPTAARCAAKPGRPTTAPWRSGSTPPPRPGLRRPGAAPTPVLILINRDPAPCHFTLPAGAWHLQFDSDQPDGHPASTDTLAPAHLDCPGRTARAGG
jgi:glycogen operon protein